MNTLSSKIVKLLALCLFFSFVGQVQATTLNLTNLTWAIDGDHDGDISDSEFTSISKLDYFSVTYVDYTPTSTTSASGTFTDYTYLWTTISDSVNSLYATTTFSGSVNNGLINLNSGSDLTWFDGSASNDVLTLTLSSGKNASGNNGTLYSFYYDENGMQEVQGVLYAEYTVTEVAQGYFYVDVNGTWVDLYDLINSGSYDEYILATSTTIQLAEPSDLNQLDTDGDGVADDDDTTISALNDLVNSGTSISDYTNNYDGTDVDYDVEHYMTTNDGNGHLYVAVPEPGMLSLMGFAFLGLAGFQRKRKSQKK